ncbi:hypothetical protein ZWY2020_028690 [Hordeum vulgare]|nr:hypothetical protein ZWY2020_028690 [Hordeum vulgare]
MRSLTREVIFGGENMRFWDLPPPWLEPLRGPNRLELSRLKKDIQPFYQIKVVNYVSPRSWLSTSHFVLGFLFLWAIYGMQEEPECHNPRFQLYAKHSCMHYKNLDV